MRFRAACWLPFFLLLTTGSSWGQEVISSDRDALRISPASYDYGEVPVGTTATSIFLVANEEKESIRVAEIFVRGNGDFRLISENCTGRLLARRESCPVEIGFTPAAATLRQAQLVARPARDDDDDDREETVADLRGTGRIVPVLTSDIALFPETVDFGAMGIDAGPDWPVETVAVVNEGSGDLRLGDVAGQNGLAPPFALVQDGCSGRRLPAGDRCFLQVSFAPTTAGDFSDQFDIPSDDPDEPQLLVLIRGSGNVPSTQPSPAISVPNPIDFGYVAVGQTKEGEIEARNTGSAPLRISRIQPTAPPFRFTVDSCSEAVLAPGSRCSVKLLFAPSGAGAFQTVVDIPSDDPARPVVQVTLHGTAGGANPADPNDPGAAPAGQIAVIDAVFPEDDLAVPFGDVPLGMAKRKLVFVSNIGTGDLQIGPIPSGPISEQFAVIGLEENRFHCSGVDGGPRILRPRQSCSVVLSFRPTSQADLTAQFSVPSDDPASESVVVSLSGAGVAASTDFPAPRLIHPDPGQIDLRRDVTFRWGNSRDSNGKMAAYRFYSSEAEDFSGSRIRVIGRGATGLAGIGFGTLFLLARRHRRRMRLCLVLAAVCFGTLILSCSESVEDSSTATLFDLEPQTTYHWKVVAEYDDGLEIESEPQIFTTR